jgi:zeaxanthin glucosyltransferase
MSRFLFVVPPLAGHVNPAGAVARALVARGHDVAWAGPDATLRRMLGDGITVYPTGMRPYGGQRDRGARALRSLWEGFVVPYARFTRPAVARAVAAYRPDVVAVDQHALAGAFVATAEGLPWASLAPQSMELAEPLRALPRVDAWIRATLASLWCEVGLPAQEYTDPRFSPHLVLGFTTPALTGPAPFPPHYALVGPALDHDRPAEPDFPWAALDPRRRLVLVTMGTLAEDVAREFYPRLVAALAPLGDRVQVVIAAAPHTVPDPPPHVLVVPRAPVLELLPRVGAVICHAGLNTVCEALAYGIPLVMAPIKHDQPVTAAQVVAAGAGVRVRFGRSRPAELRAALTEVLDTPTYRAAAARVSESFASAGGATAAATHLERLAHKA